MTGRARRARGAFSLLEMMAVILLVSIVFFVAVDFYRELTRSSARAADRTRNARRAVSLLDRVARDLEASVLLKKPDGTDPLAHPWLFLGEGNGSGATRLKFVTRSPSLRASKEARSDLSLVAWLVAPAEDGALELRRWSAPDLPEELEHELPPAEEALVVARDLTSFGVRFLNDNGEWKNHWDSSQLVDADALPRAAEIEVGLLPTDPGATPEGVTPEPELYTRLVLLPVRPLDMQELVTGKASEGEAAKDENGDGEPDEPDEEEAQACVTVRQCLAKNPEVAEAAAALGLQDVLEAVGDQCYSTVAGNLPPELVAAGCD